jgi:RNA polymerase sigma-70 factor (ECF subfamily)
MREPAGSDRFLTTHWSVVLAAGAEASARKRDALSALCETYWYPLYAYARRRGTPPEQAQDLVQGFLCKLLETDRLGAADPERGRFRSFLLTAFANHSANEWAKGQAQKRGGGRRVFSFTGGDPEARLRLEPAHSATPERLYTRDWALTVLDRVLDQLGQTYAQKGQEAFFAVGKDLLAGQAKVGEHAAALGMTANAFRVGRHRRRKRYREALRAEVAQTLAEGQDVEEELGELLAALAAPG